jgi:hypothetical protein
MRMFTRVGLLSDDLCELLGNWGTNALRTAAQRARWRKQKLSQRWFSDGRNGKEPSYLILLVEDGWDGLPVGSRKPNAAERFFSYQHDHCFPPPRDLVRLGMFLHLDVYHTLALVLKSEWEKFFAQKMKWKHTKCGHPERDDLLEILMNRDEATALKSSFNPDTTALFSLFAEEGNRDKIAASKGIRLSVEKDGDGPPEIQWPSKEVGTDVEGVRITALQTKHFDTLVQEMICADLHLAANASPELEAFAQRAAKELWLILNGPPGQEETFWLAKASWLELLERLGELLLVLENRRLENANIAHKWWTIFGGAYVTLQEQADRVAVLRLAIELKDAAGCNLSREKLEEEIRKAFDEKSRRLQAEQVAASLGWNGTDPVDGAAISDQEFAEYRRECKRVAREIFFLIAEDTLKHHPSYAKLTDEQKGILRELFDRIMAIKPWEVGYPNGMLGHHERKLEPLLDILAQVKAILANAGLSTDVKLISQGETLAEQMEWLNQAIKNIKRDLETVCTEIKVLGDDPIIREKQATLARPEKHEKVKEDMLERAEEYRKEADELQKRLDVLFEQGSPAC